MPRGSKAKYTDKQKRQARHIEESAEKRGYSTKRAAQIGWATVNKQDHGGKKSGSGVGRKSNTSSSRAGGRASHSGRGRISASRAAKASHARGTR
jgi:hypothetical protein